MKQRIIKFRGWHKKDKKMFYDITPYWDYITFNTMQYTGLKDKNKKEIYEGDIIKYDDVGNLIPSGIYEVRFEEGLFEPFSSLGTPSQIKKYKWPKSWGIDNTVEVIGNIYKNKDLLK